MKDNNGIKELKQLSVSPIPWTYEEDSNDIICHLGNGLHYQVATPYLHMADDTTEDNTRMICASPLMYQRLYESNNELRKFVESCQVNGTEVPKGLELQIQLNEAALKLASEGEEYIEQKEVELK